LVNTLHWLFYIKPKVYNQKSTLAQLNNDINIESAMELFDTHCHIDFNDFDIDRDDVINGASKKGVNHILVPSVSQHNWHKTIDVCQHYNSCKLALGLHPVFIEQHQPQHLIELDLLIDQHAPVAVKQSLFFAKQLIIAKQHQLPVIIHNRKAHDDCLSMLKEYDINRGIIHAFNGSIQQAEHYIERGFLLGFGGMLTFERSRKLRELAKQIPLTSIVLETDAPDMTVKQFKGQRNSPAYIPYVLEALSEIKSLPLNDVAQITTNNATNMLGSNI